jgi:hypothetical protein
MDRVTGSLARGAVDPPDESGGGFEAKPGPVLPRRADRRRAGAAVAAIAVVVFAGSAGAVAQHLIRPAERLATATSASGPSRADPLVARRATYLAPMGQLTAIGTAPAARTVVAIPGCEVTLQLGPRQPRRVVQCPEVLPQDLGRMLAVNPRQQLRFEVPGWQVRPDDEVLGTPDQAGMWTVAVPACLSRGRDWLCATWYATVNVQR